jgi:hypothetical protein
VEIEYCRSPATHGDLRKMLNRATELLSVTDARETKEDEHCKAVVDAHDASPFPAAGDE